MRLTVAAKASLLLASTGMCAAPCESSALPLSAELIRSETMLGSTTMLANESAVDDLGRGFSGGGATSRDGATSRGGVGSGDAVVGSAGASGPTVRTSAARGTVIA